MSAPDECEAVRVAAMAIADGEMPPLSREQIRDHLEVCAACRGCVDQPFGRLLPAWARRQRHDFVVWPAVRTRLAEAAVVQRPPTVRWPAAWLPGVSVSVALVLMALASAGLYSLRQRLGDSSELGNR